MHGCKLLLQVRGQMFNSYCNSIGGLSFYNGLKEMTLNYHMNNNFLYKCTHSRQQNITFSKFLMHFQPWESNFKTFPGDHMHSTVPGEVSTSSELTVLAFMVLYDQLTCPAVSKISIMPASPSITVCRWYASSKMQGWHVWLTMGFSLGVFNSSFRKFDTTECPSYLFENPMQKLFPTATPSSLSNVQKANDFVKQKRRGFLQQKHSMENAH